MFPTQPPPPKKKHQNVPPIQTLVISCLLPQVGTAIWPGENSSAVLLGVQKLPAEAALSALGGQDTIARGDARAPPGKTPWADGIGKTYGPVGPILRQSWASHWPT